MKSRRMNTALVLILMAVLPCTSALLHGTRAREQIKADGEPVPVPIPKSDDLSAELWAEAGRLSEESPGIEVEEDSKILRQLHERMLRFVEQKIADHPLVEAQAGRIPDYANYALLDGFSKNTPRGQDPVKANLAQNSSIQIENRNIKVEVGYGKIPEVATSVPAGFNQIYSKSLSGVEGGSLGHLDPINPGDNTSWAELADEILVALKPLMDLTKIWAPKVTALIYSNLVGLQLLLGIIYAIVILRLYPRMPLVSFRERPPEAVNLIRLSPCDALLRCDVSPQICLSSCCAWGARAAHTYHSTRTMNYWIGLLLMSTLPCCTLFFVAGCCNVRTRLGGMELMFCESCLCSLCCCPCVIAQEAQTLDLVMGVETGFFGFEAKYIYD